MFTDRGLKRAHLDKSVRIGPAIASCRFLKIWSTYGLTAKASHQIWPFAERPRRCQNAPAAVRPPLLHPVGEALDKFADDDRSKGLNALNVQDLSASRDVRLAKQVRRCDIEA